MCIEPLPSSAQHGIPDDTPPGAAPQQPAVPGGSGSISVKPWTPPASVAPKDWLKDGGKVLDTMDRLKTKAKDAPLSLDEQRELDHAEKNLASVQVANLEKEQQVIRGLPQPRELDPHKAQALDKARAVRQRPVPGEAPAAAPSPSSIPDATTPTGPESGKQPGAEGTNAPPANGATGPRLQFSQGGANPKPTADSDIVDAHRLLSQEEDAFQLGKSKPNTSKMSTDKALNALAKSYSQDGLELKVRREGPTNRSFRIETPNGEAVITLDHDNKTLRINSANLDSNTTKRGGGANVYQMASTFAQQHGYKFLPDKIVQPVAQNRRISQMISSVLRHGGSTKHFDGDATFQGAQTGDQMIANEKPVTKAELPGWKAGDDEHNLALMLRREHTDVMAAAKARGIDLSHLTYDPESHTIFNGHTGTPLTEGALKSLVDRFEPGDSGVGKTTLLRALVTGSTLQGRRSDGSIQPVHNNAGGNSGGLDTGESNRNLVRLARGLYYSRPSGGAGGVSPRRMGDALSERPNGLATAVAQVSDHLKTQVPGLLHDKTHVFHSVEDLLNSDYAKEHPLSKEDLDKIHSAEGFHDPITGHSAIIAENVELRPGETPHDALTRVILHERVGHDGLQTLLGSKNSKAQKHWEGLTKRIKPEELDAIANQEGYKHLAGDRNALAHEWFARQAEKSPHLLKRPGVLRDMWEAFKGQLRKASNYLKNTDESRLDTHLHELLRHSRKAALRGPSGADAQNGPATINGARGVTSSKDFSLAYRARQQNQDTLAQEASQSILNHDNSTTNSTTAGRHSDRSGGNAQTSTDAVTSALLGGAEGTVPGWAGAAGQRRRAEWEREYLNRRATPPTDKGVRFAEGGEHHVYARPGEDFVTKATHSGRYGQVLDQMGPGEGHRFNLRPASPSEYITRLGLTNKIFGSTNRIVGYEQTPEGPSIITTQRALRGPHPTQDRAEAFLRAHGFEPMDEKLYDAKTINKAKRPWYRPKDGVVVVDAKKQNFVVHNGKIIPVDLMIQLLPDNVLDATRAARMQR